MEKGLNFRTQKGQEDYFEAYDKTLELWEVPYTERYIETSFGKSHCLICGNPNASPLILLHAASCGATIWYPNVADLSQKYCIYAVDLITESSKSILSSKIKSPEQSAKWLNETLDGLNLNKVYLCGLSVGGWNAAIYAIAYPARIQKLILLSPVQTLAKMYPSFFIKIMRMGFRPTRKNVENYIGWGSVNEASLPDSVIRQFTISIMNVNSNAAFPKMIKKQKLRDLKMPVMILLGKNEFVFNINKAVAIGRAEISNLNIEIIENASHLISVSLPKIINDKIVNFLEENNG